MPLTKGLPALSDLSEARFGDSEQTGNIMPEVYRAPEVVLGMPWSYPVDIWSFGMVVCILLSILDPSHASCFQDWLAEFRYQLWDLFEPNRLFSGRSQNGHYSEVHHLAQMVSILGPPPLDFLRRSEKSKRFWNVDGK